MTSKKRDLHLIEAGIAGASGLAVYLFAVRPWHRRWGATDEEVGQAMPGDDRVENANFETTRAITIKAPPAEVWPWLAQMGQGRGGLYSYDWLENLMGLDIHSADHIVPELQNLQVGDVIALEPGGSGYHVAAIEPNRLLVLYIDGTSGGEMGGFFAKAGAASTWVYLLKELDPATTRLIVRWRARYPLTGVSDPLLFLVGLTLDPAEFIMERKMLLGIKKRAEAGGSW